MCWLFPLGDVTENAGRDFRAFRHQGQCVGVFRKWYSRIGNGLTLPFRREDPLQTADEVAAHLAVVHDPAPGHCNSVIHPFATEIVEYARGRSHAFGAVRIERDGSRASPR